MSVALITGASRGLGLALARALAERDWDLVVDARGGDALEAARSSLAGTGRGQVTAVAGDVADGVHRRRLVDAARDHGGLDLLVNNASILGLSPQPVLADYPLETLEHVYAVNVLAPLALVQLGLPLLEAVTGSILNVTSDAGVEGYEGWGGYGSSKAALEQWSRVLAAEKPDLRVWWVDPGDMRTQMHQEAFPGEDISDRPLPDDSVVGLLRLIDEGLPSGRYRTGDLAPAGDPAGAQSPSEPFPVGYEAQA
ncbi:MAG: SDR family oxidoreductase [Actinomycetota bacterium]|nr:SDR family oxidoreductase [Actinomycetota bacterium]